MFSHTKSCQSLEGNTILVSVPCGPSSPGKLGLSFIPSIQTPTSGLLFHRKTEKKLLKREFSSHKPKMDSLFLELFISLLLGILIGEISSTGEVVYAVNSGGPAHTDLNGVHYQADKLTVGTSSDFGKSLSIGRVAPADQILYQTERYHFSNFGYNIPIKENGDYVLILKFCEVYFQAPRLKVSSSARRASSIHVYEFNRCLYRSGFKLAVTSSLFKLILRRLL